MDFPERIFFVTTVTAQRKPLFRYERPARMLLDTLFNYRSLGIFQLFEFVVMPDHVHLILFPKTTVALEKAMQFIKGGYSHRYMKETGSKIEIWQRSFTNHRIRDWDDFEKQSELYPFESGAVRIVASAAGVPLLLCMPRISPGRGATAAKACGLRLLIRPAEAGRFHGGTNVHKSVKKVGAIKIK